MNSISGKSPSSSFHFSVFFLNRIQTTLFKKNQTSINFFINIWLFNYVRVKRTFNILCLYISVLFQYLNRLLDEFIELHGSFFRQLDHISRVFHRGNLFSVKFTLNLMRKKALAMNDLHQSLLWKLSIINNSLSYKMIHLYVNYLEERWSEWEWLMTNYEIYVYSFGNNGLGFSHIGFMGWQNNLI